MYHFGWDVRRCNAWRMRPGRLPVGYADAVCAPERAAAGNPPEARWADGLTWRVVMMQAVTRPRTAMALAAARYEELKRRSECRGAGQVESQSEGQSSHHESKLPGCNLPVHGPAPRRPRANLSLSLSLSLSLFDKDVIIIITMVELCVCKPWLKATSYLLQAGLYPANIIFTESYEYLVEEVLPCCDKRKRARSQVKCSSSDAATGPSDRESNESKVWINLSKKSGSRMVMALAAARYEEFKRRSECRGAGQVESQSEGQSFHHESKLPGCNPPVHGPAPMCSGKRSTRFKRGASQKPCFRRAAARSASATLTYQLRDIYPLDVFST